MLVGTIVIIQASTCYIIPDNLSLKKGHMHNTKLTSIKLMAVS